MADSFEDMVSSPFDGIISLAPWFAAAAIALSIYILVRSLLTFRVLKNIKHELSTEDIRFMKIQSTLNIVFSAIFMACGVMLIVYLQ
ncbi:hypothetical protein O3K13_06680 [Yersinia pestis]|nr:hypothetical protein [Yersinia pestis]